MEIVFHSNVKRILKKFKFFDSRSLHSHHVTKSSTELELMKQISELERQLSKANNKLAAEKKSETKRTQKFVVLNQRMQG